MKMNRNNNNQDPTMYKKLLDEEGDLMFHDEEDQQPNNINNEKKNGDYKLVGAVAVPVNGNRKPNKSSCCSLSCLCKCAIITLTIFVMLGVIATGAAYYWMKDVVEHLTVVEPLDPFPIVDMTDAELEVVKDRVKLFVDQLRTGHPGNVIDDLVITQDEINGFIGHSDYLRGNMQLTIEDNKITEQYSLPVDMLPGGKGRYYVGEDYFKFLDADGVDGNESRFEFEVETAATHEDWFKGPLVFAQLQYLVNHKDHKGFHHLLELYIKEGSFFGNVVPQDFIDQHVNLLEDFDEDPDNYDALMVMDGIESVSIEKGKIIIHPRKNHKEEEVVDEEVSMEAWLQVEEDETEDLTIATTTTKAAPTNKLRKKDPPINNEKESYTFAKKIDGNVGSHNMRHHNHKHNHMWKMSSSSSSSDSSSSDSSSDE